MWCIWNLIFKEKSSILLGSPNSDEAPNDTEQAPLAQSLPRNGQAATTVSRFFDCCKASNESVTTDVKGTC